MNNRRALLDAARTLVAAKGVKAATIAQIASRAGVAKGLLFYYFKDKDSIIQAITEELDAHYMAALQSRPKMPKRENEMKSTTPSGRKILSMRLPAPPPIMNESA